MDARSSPSAAPYITARTNVPAVSIIVPTFNRTAFIATAIQSVFAQSFVDWELLIADDGSDPDTLAYLRTLEAPPAIRVLSLPHSGNPPAVRNAALRQARGEYVAFLDSDDVWLPGKLQVQIAALRSGTTRQWSYTGFTLVDSAGAPLTGSEAKAWPTIAGPFLDALLRGEPLIMQSSVMVRRELLQSVGGYDEELPVCGDYALWIRLAQHSEIDLIDAPLVLVRRHNNPYFDEVRGLGDLGKLLEKVQRSGVAPHMAAVLRQRCAGVAAGLALAHARSQSRRAALSTLSSSVWHSWLYAAWWSGALRATALALAPRQLLGIVNRYRAARRGANRAT
jgi:glycosyltransferase involved in cell wall biosynthesis